MVSAELETAESACDLALGRLTGRIHLELVDWGNLLGVAALGTIAAFTCRISHAAFGLVVPEAQLGKSRKLVLFGFPVWHSHNRWIFLHGRSNSPLATVNAGRHCSSTADPAKCPGKGPNPLGN